MSDFVELQKIINAAIRSWWLLIAATIVGALLGLVLSQRQTPVYSASTTLLVGQSIQSTELESRDMAISQQMALTYAKLARLQPVMQAAADRLDMDTAWQTLAKRVRATPVEGTQLLRISVEAGSPEDAMILANSIAETVISLSPAANLGKAIDENQQFIRERLDFLRTNIEQGQQRVETLEVEMLTANSVTQMQEIQAEIDIMQGLIVGWEGNYARMSTVIRQPGSANSLTVVESAQGSTSPIRPRTKQNMLVMALVSFTLVFGIVVLQEVMDDTIRSTTDIPDDVGLEVLGAIGHIRGKNKLVTARKPSSPISKAYAMVFSATRSKYGNHPPATILVTSPSAGDGKSTTAANLGVAMAQAGLQIIVADMNLEGPALHRIFNVPEEGGVIDALRSQEIDVKSLLKGTNIETLHVLTSGTQYQPKLVHPLRADKKNSNNGDHTQKDDIVRPRFNKLTPDLDHLLTRLDELADVVILDGSPLLTTIDAATLSAQADGVILVIEAGQTRSTAAQAVAMLRRMEVNLIGGILNEAPRLRSWNRNQRHTNGIHAVKEPQPNR